MADPNPVTVEEDAILARLLTLNLERATEVKLPLPAYLTTA